MSDELLNRIALEIDRNPAILGGLFKLVSDNWERMVEAQRMERESSHRYALSQMLSNLWLTQLNRKRNPALFNSDQCCTLLDALDAVNPQCAPANGMWGELLTHCAKSFRALGWTPECDFIRSIRGREQLLQNLYNNFPEGEKE
jgi:hypothetical protein